MAGDGQPILIVDPDDEFRRAAADLLRRAHFSIQEAASGEEALEAVSRQRPSLVLLEVCLPGLSGYEVCRELRDEFGEELPIVFVSAVRTEPLDRVAGLLLGASDYLARPFDPGELLARVRGLVQRAFDGAHDGVAGRLELLTQRESQVLQLLAAGATQEEIASELVISEKTVASHIQRILAKLQVHSRAQAVALAHRQGFVETQVRRASAHSG